MDFAIEAALTSPWQWLAIPAACVYGVGLEWMLQRALFHSARPQDAASVHAAHRRACRQHGNFDPVFSGSVLRWNAYGQEALGLALLALLHAPLLWVAPLGYAALLAFGLRYHRIHRRCHVDPDWGRTHAPWHWAHHMGPDAFNWGVSTDLMDRILGTQRGWSVDPLPPAPPPGLRTIVPREAPAPALSSHHVPIPLSLAPDVDGIEPLVATLAPSRRGSSKGPIPLYATLDPARF